MTPTPSSRISWSSHTVARIAQAYGISPTTLTSRRRDSLLVETRRGAMALLAERGLGPCWIARYFSATTVQFSITWLRFGRAARHRNRRCSLHSGVPPGGRPNRAGKCLSRRARFFSSLHDAQDGSAPRVKYGHGAGVLVG